MPERLPLVRVDGRNRQLPAGDRIPAAAIAPAMPYLDDPVDASALRDALVAAGIMQGPAIVAPVNTSPPVVSGAIHVGDTATATPGTWTGSPTSYAYQWQVDPGTGWEDLLGETASTYEVDAAGEYRVQVIATNAAGDSDPAYSAEFVVTEPSSGLEWDGGWRATLAGASATGSGSGAQFGHAYTDPLPAGLVYIEVETSALNMDLRPGIWAKDTLVDPGATLPTGQYFQQQSAGMTAGNIFNMYVYANEAFVAGVSPNTSGDPLRRIGIAVNVAGRAAWFRQVWASGSSAWVGGGNPAAGTTPSAVMGGAEVIRLAASLPPGLGARIVAPEDHFAAAPAGFAAL